MRVCVSVLTWQVQFQKIQQLRLSQTRAPYYGGSLPNVNQIGNTSNDFQVGNSPRQLRCMDYPSAPSIMAPHWTRPTKLVLRK
jgi:hypothetical protein